MSSKGGKLTIALTLLGLTLAAYPMWSDWWRAKSMNIVVASASPLISPGTEDTDLRLFVGQQRLENPYLVLLSVINDGGTAVTTSDFESPIRIDFSPATVVRVSRASSDENIVHGTFQVNNSSVLIAPTLFNPGDDLELAVITTGAVPKVRVDARVVGIQKIPVAMTQKAPKPPVWLNVLHLIAMAILAVCASLLWRRIGFRAPKSVTVPDTAGIFIAWAVFMGSMASAVKGISPYTDDASNIGPWIVFAIIGISWLIDRKLASTRKTKED